MSGSKSDTWLKQRLDRWSVPLRAAAALRGTAVIMPPSLAPRPTFDRSLKADSAATPSTEADDVSPRFDFGTFELSRFEYSFGTEFATQSPTWLPTGYSSDFDGSHLFPDSTSPGETPQSLEVVGDDWASAIAEHAATAPSVESATVRVQEVAPSIEPARATAELQIGETRYFVTWDPKRGDALWKSDAAGDVLLHEFSSFQGPWPPTLHDDPGIEDWSVCMPTIANLTAFGNRLFFTADAGERGEQLWTSNGTPSGTLMISSLESAGPGAVGQLAVCGGSLFFTAVRCDGQTDLWGSKGNKDDHVLLRTFRRPQSAEPLLAPAINDLTDVDGVLFFAAYSDNEEKQLWKSDGTVEGTGPVKPAAEPAPVDSKLEEVVTSPISEPRPVVSEAVGAALAVVEGQRFNRTLASFRVPPNADRITAHIEWGDGQSSSGAVTNDEVHIRVAGAHVYRRHGRYQVRIAVRADRESHATAENVALVSDAALHAERVHLRSTVGRPFHGIVATFRDDNPLGRSDDFQAEIAWGDGMVSSGKIESGVDGVYSVHGAHVYSAEGAFSIDIRIRSSGGSCARACSQAKVHEPRMVARGLTSVGAVFAETPRALAAFTDNDRNARPDWFTASIDWGEQTSPGVIETDDHGSFRVMGAHRFSKIGVHSVRVRIADAAGNEVQAVATARVIPATSD